MSTCGSTAHMRNQTSYRSQQNRSAYRLVRTAAFADSLAALKVQEVVPTADTVMPVDNSKPSVLSMIANPGNPCFTNVIGLVCSIAHNETSSLVWFGLDCR